MKQNNFPFKQNLLRIVNARVCQVNCVASCVASRVVSKPKVKQGTGVNKAHSIRQSKIFSFQSLLSRLRFQLSDLSAKQTRTMHSRENASDLVFSKFTFIKPSLASVTCGHREFSKALCETNEARKESKRWSARFFCDS